MEEINYCIAVPADVNLSLEESYNELYDLLIKTIKKELYSHRQDDICSVQLYEEGGNIIFAYKVVPPTARSMSAYSHYYALVVKKTQIVKVKGE